MSKITDMFDHEVLFSKENPFLKSAEKTHRKIFESFDKTARLQLAFAGDLLDLNRKRFEALYTSDNLVDVVSAHQDLATEIGKRTANWAGDLQEVVVDLQNSVAKAPAAKAKKAKAA